MKIKNVTVSFIRLPFKKPFVLAYTSYTDMPSIIVEIETDCGLIGFGEGVPDQHVTGETWQATYANIVHYLAPAVIGKNPFDIEQIHETMDQILYGMPTAKAAIDLACYDLMGKASGQPVYRLIGGRQHEHLVVPEILGIGTKEEMAAGAAAARDKGCTELKIKVGTDPDEDIQRIRAVRESAGPEMKIRVDANQGWGDAATTLKVLREVEDCDLGWIEQPVAADDLHALAEVRRKTTIPVMADEGVHGPVELRRIIELGSADLINIKLMKCGGLYPAQKLAAQAELAGIRCIVGSMIESAIATAAGAHFAFSRKGIIGNEMGGPILFGEDVAATEYRGEYLCLNDRPGWGLEVDPPTLDKLRIKKETVSGGGEPA